MHATGWPACHKLNLDITWSGVQRSVAHKFTCCALRMLADAACVALIDRTISCNILLWHVLSVDAFLGLLRCASVHECDRVCLCLQQLNGVSCVARPGSSLLLDDSHILSKPHRTISGGQLSPSTSLLCCSGLVVILGHDGACVTCFASTTEQGTYHVLYLHTMLHNVCSYATTYLMKAVEVVAFQLRTAAT
jgi:hypothetical protein